MNTAIAKSAPEVLLEFTPEEWLESLFARASISMLNQCRSELDVLSDELKIAWEWLLLEVNHPAASWFLELLGVVNKACWGVLNESWEMTFDEYVNKH